MNKYAENGLVSVIIPTYKRSDTLVRALESVLAQTYKNIEIIVVDDNAEFPEIRRHNEILIAKYPKVILVENEKNLGGGLSRNEGIKVASGKYVAFLDDDDEYLPEKIEKQLNCLNSHDEKTSVVYCYAEMINVNGSRYTYINDFEGDVLLENIEHCLAPTSFWLCDREKLLSVGGFENISSRQDASLLTKLFLSGYTVYRVPEVLLRYYWHNSINGISNSSLKSVNAEKQYHLMFSKLACQKGINKGVIDKADYLFYFRLAREYLAIGYRKDALLLLKKMLKIKVFDIRNLRILCTSLFNKTYLFVAFLKNKKRIGK